MDEKFWNRVGHERISDRQTDELIGLARGVALDGRISKDEAEFLQKWLAANLHITRNPLINTLYVRISEMLVDNVLDADEEADLLSTINQLSSRDIELGEVLKATTLPLCDPAPDVRFDGMRFAFTGTFIFGTRKVCESAATTRGASTGSITRDTDFLVIGTYATDSWKHSSFGTKILKAVDYREKGVPISIISEAHWIKFL